MSSLANSRPDAFDVALIGLSVRALARSARKGRRRALALDLFADVDTREHAAKAVRVPGRDGGLDPAALQAALDEHAPAGVPVVFGSGFEDQTGLMAEIGRRHPICGAGPDVVTRLKDPFAFADLLRSLGVAHPEVAQTGGAGWLSKRVGGSGGAHIRAAGESDAKGRYAQRRLDGTPFSALFLADGKRAFVIGFSEQWADPTTTAPYRYGGAVGPIDVPLARNRAVAAALAGVVAATGLVGLASADLLAPDDSSASFVLLEINPRPGATLDLFDCAPTRSLLAAHIAAWGGALPAFWPQVKRVRAAAVVYAPRACSLAGVERPVWTADWPAGGQTIPRGAPVCTVLATARTPLGTRALLERRRTTLLDAVFSSRHEAASPPAKSDRAT